MRGQVGRLLLCREQAESGWLLLRLSEHDGERLDDQGAQAEQKERVAVSVTAQTLQGHNVRDPTSGCILKPLFYKSCISFS